MSKKSNYRDYVFITGVSWETGGPYEARFSIGAGHEEMDAPVFLAEKFDTEEEARIAAIAEAKKAIDLILDNE